MFPGNKSAVTADPVIRNRLYLLHKLIRRRGIKETLSFCVEKVSRLGHKKASAPGSISGSELQRRFGQDHSPIDLRIRSRIKNECKPSSP
jgi:hypothetical protein